MADIDVSVIIATYNVEAYIERAITSALNQSGVTVEVIMVDDCSTDQTVSLAEALNDPRLTILRMPRNGGPSAARNAAIEAAQGKWIAILDGDDAFAPDRLARMLDCASATQAEIIVDNITVLKEEDNTTSLMFPEPWFGELKTIDLIQLMRSSTNRATGYPLHCLKPLFLTSFIRQTKTSYDPDIRIGEDYLFFADLLAYGARCNIAPIAGYIYTRRRGSISFSIAPAAWDIMIKAEQLFLTRHTLRPESRKEVTARLSFMHDMKNYESMVAAIKQRRFGAALGLMIRHPWAARRLLEPVLKRLRKLTT